MALSDAFERGLGIGEKYGKFSSIRDAIKGVVDKYNQQEQLTSTYGTKAIMDNMFSGGTEWKPKSMEESLAFEKAKAGIVSPDKELGRYKTELDIQKLEQDLGATQQAADKEVDFIRESASSGLNTVRKIKEGKKYFGPLGNLPTSATPELIFDYKNRKQWENEVQKLLSQKVVDLITTMKSASKTGATGFGQLNEKEGQLLKEASTALSRDLDPDSAMYYLDEMEKMYQKILTNETSGQQTSRNPFVKPQSSMSDEQAMAEYEAFMRGE